MGVMAHLTHFLELPWDTRYGHHHLECRHHLEFPCVECHGHHLECHHHHHQDHLHHLCGVIQPPCHKGCRFILLPHWHAQQKERMRIPNSSRRMMCSLQ